MKNALIEIKYHGDISIFLIQNKIEGFQVKESYNEQNNSHILQVFMVSGYIHDLVFKDSEECLKIRDTIKASILKSIS